MNQAKLLLVSADALPEVFRRVVEAKQYLMSGAAANTSEAARMAGISRSAYYKYKDSVYPYQSKGASRLVTIHAVLEDRPGVLMALISSFYDAGESKYPGDGCGAGFHFRQSGYRKNSGGFSAGFPEKSRRGSNH